MSRVQNQNRINGKFIALSDSHFFHGNILKYDGRTQFMTDNDLAIYDEYKKTGNRGDKISFESIRNMNEAILDNINHAVEDADRDTVLIGGDFVFGNNPKQIRDNACYCRNRIACRDVRIVFGNHDNPDIIYDLFSHCYQQVLLEVGRGTFLFVSHFPMITWDGPRGTIHLYGHVHGRYEDKVNTHPMVDHASWLAKDIGVNTNNYRPYTITQIREYFKKPIRHLGTA